MTERTTAGMSASETVVSELVSPSPPRELKERLTVHLPITLIDRVKNAVFWTPGLTLASLAEEAFVRMVDELESREGQPFPHRHSQLKGGRPLK